MSTNNRVVKVLSSLFLFVISVYAAVDYMVGIAYDDSITFGSVFAIILYSVVITVSMICFIAFALSPSKQEEALGEMQDMEVWLYDEGYCRYCGKTEIVSDLIVFGTGEDKVPFRIKSEKTGEHGNYTYWKYDDYCVVRSNKVHSADRYYVKVAE